MKRSLTAFLLLSTVSSAWAAPPAPTQTMPLDMREVFNALTLPDAPNRYRSGSGRPGPDYWQNRADYAIRARIDTAAHVLHGKETITYTNNSPDTLDMLWVQLDQNIYRADSRSGFANPERHARTTDGAVIETLVVSQDGHDVTVTPLVTDTRMQVRLPRALAAHGKIRIKVAWHHTIPGPWGGRTSVTPVQDGDIYEVAQWYPRMSVYDDKRGWDTLPYLGQEFYLDYGNFDYAITVPWNFTVVGSGALTNPQDVLTKTERDRLERAGKSDARVLIRTPQDVTDPHSHVSQDGEKTWRFHMENTRDVSFAASPMFVWDAARINLPALPPAPGMKPVPRLAMSVYPREGAGPQAWDRSTEYVKHAIEYFSQQWFEYPWPNAVNLGGHGAGMEYPGIVFDGWKDHGSMLFWITTHELGHGWFPMIVGSNERRDAFMDEGFNTFIDAYASQHFNKGEYAPKQDSEFAPKTGKPADDIIPVLTDPNAPVLMLPSELVAEKYRHNVTYFKSAYGLMLLREQILGPDRFDAAFRAYIRAWAFRHPGPSDFFRFMQSETGEDLTWFWRGWYFRNWSPDYALEHIGYVDNDPTHGTEITLRNKGKLLLPVTLRVEYADDTHIERRVPTESWYLHDQVVVTVPGKAKVVKAVLDPDHELPEPVRSDNVLSPN